MKKIAFLVFLLAVCVAAGRAQESRQDISLSGTALIEPFMASSTDRQVHSTTAYGGLASYRFMLTPTSALEANYGITYQNTITYYGPQFPNGIYHSDPHPGDLGRLRALLRLQELQSLCRGRPGGNHLPAHPQLRHQTLDAKQQTEVGGMYGAGFAYEISPSFDIRVEYRGLVTKVPTFGVGNSNYNFTTNRWYNISVPPSAWPTTSNVGSQRRIKNASDPSEVWRVFPPI